MRSELSEMLHLDLEPVGIYFANTGAHDAARPLGGHA